MNNEEKILELLTEMKAEMSGMKADMTGMKAEMFGMKADISALQADVSEMQTTLTRVAVTQESVVLPRLDLLAEGHTHLAETLAGKSRVEKLEDDVAMLKDVIKLMRQEIAQLKEAQ